MTTTLPRLLSVKQINEVTGWSKPTIYRYIDAGMLPVVKVFGRLQVSETELAKLIKNNTEIRGRSKRSYKIV